MQSCPQRGAGFRVRVVTLEKKANTARMPDEELAISPGGEVGASLQMGQAELGKVCCELLIVRSL